jgi:hypothetical protein
MEVFELPTDPMVPYRFEVAALEICDGDSSSRTTSCSRDCDGNVAAALGGAVSDAAEQPGQTGYQPVVSY